MELLLTSVSLLAWVSAWLIIRAGGLLVSVIVVVIVIMVALSIMVVVAMGFSLLFSRLLLGRLFRICGSLLFISHDYE